MVWGRESASTTSLYRFPHSNFKYFLTLFSKFFSSFPHGTCSLSVSHQYLALDGIYHQIRAAFPSNSTLWMRVMDGSARNERRDSHPLWYRVPTDLHRSASRTATPIDYNSQLIRSWDFQVELIPLHSPLLGESLLVSFPLLSYMLKSRRSSYLISDPRLNV